jgi:hypothetical protein
MLVMLSHLDYAAKDSTPRLESVSVTTAATSFTSCAVTCSLIHYYTIAVPVYPNVAVLVYLLVVDPVPVLLHKVRCQRCPLCVIAVNEASAELAAVRSVCFCPCVNAWAERSIVVMTVIN